MMTIPYNGRTLPNKMNDSFRILLCATDAGGGRNLEAIAVYLAKKRPNIHVDILFGRITTQMFQAYMPDAQLAKIETHDEAIKTLEQLRPDVVILGRTRYISPERRLTIAARKLDIPTVQVVDDWMNYRLNVADNHDALTHITDLICCPDAMAVAGAQAEGLPPESLVITGSPALSKLCDQIHAMTCTPPPVPEVMASENDRPVILFLSETFVADHGDGSEPRSHGPYLGYTEQTVRTDLAKAVVALKTPALVVEKLHPSETTIPPAPLMAEGVDWVSVGGTDLFEMIAHADMVIGMRSMALLESALAGRPTVSYQPDLQTADSCTAALLELVPALRDQGELTEWLRQSHSSDKTLPKRPDFADAQAAASVVNNALSLVCHSVVAHQPWGNIEP